MIILLNHLVMIAFGVTAMGMLEQEEHKLWLWSLLLMIPILFYWAKKRIHNLLLFYAVHLAVPAGVIFLPVQIVPKFLMLLISIVYVVWSIKIGIIARGHGDGVVGPVYMIAVLGITLLIETFYSQKGWEIMYLTMAIIYAAGYCMYIFISQYLGFVVANESSAANIPETEIFNKGFRDSFTYIAGVVALLVLAAKVEWLYNIDSWIVTRTGNVLMRIFKFFFMGDDGKEEEINLMVPVEQESSDVEMLLEASESALPALDFEKPIIYGGILIIVGLAIFGIVKGIKYLWKGFRKTSVISEENNGIDIRETCTIEKNKKEGSNWFSFLDNREKIRKLYRKRVLKHKTVIIGNMVTEGLGYMTAKECCDKFAAEKLQKKYEKARYSAEEITSDDVREVKSERK